MAYNGFMRIDDFIWLPQIVEKVEVKHHVSQDEAEAVFYNAPYFRFVERGHRTDEDVYAALGRTDGGRYLIVFFVYKPNGNAALILSARAMDPAERRRYDRR